MFTDSQKDSIKEILAKYLFKNIDQDKFVFANKSTTSIASLLKHIGAPQTFRDAGLLELALECMTQGNKSLGQYWPAFVDVMKEVSVSNPKLEINSVDVTQFDNDEAEDPTSYIQTLIPVVNITKNAKDNIILLDPHRDHRPALEINPEVYMALMGTDSFKLTLDKSILKALTVFDPYTLKSLFVRESAKGAIKTWHVNYYVPPRWRFVHADARYGGFIKKLIEHLFPNANELEYVLDWLHYAVAYRNETMLCLVGARGTGKGILLKDILSMLVGVDYREIVNQEILTDKFNGAFKNRRYLFFDEVNISGERELNKVKAFCNSHIVVEEKGQDSETIDNYTSLALSSNDKRDFRAEPQERRFSVPEITDLPLLKIATEAEIDAFIEDISNPESVTLAEFGEFLLQRKPKTTSRQPLKGKHFFDLCRLSMPEWKTYMIEFIAHEGVDGEHILCSNLTKKFKKIHGDNAPFATKRGSIETFLTDYYHEGACRVGRVVDAWDAQRGRDTFAIVPDPEFLKRYGTNKPLEGGVDSALDAL